MKKAFKDWVTNIFAIIVWIASTYLFIIDKLETNKFLILIGVGFILLFIHSGTIWTLLKKYINKKIG
jgi:hypothetical protein